MSSEAADLQPPDRDGWAPVIPDALDLVLEVDTMLSVFTAQRYVRVAAVHREARIEAERRGGPPTDVWERALRLELAAALGITEYVAGTLLTHSDALVNRYPTVLDALSEARLTPRHAIELVEALDGVEPDVREALAVDALALAESHPVGAFRRALRALIEDARQTTLAQRHEQALQARRVIVQPAEDGMAWLMMFGPAVEVHAAHGRLTAIGKVLGSADDETRTLDQLRADACGDLLIDGDTDALPPQARGIRATVVVTVPVLALLDAPRIGGGVASVEGVGPIPMERARELCGTADGWMRVLTHPETGMVLSVGRDRYRPPPELRRLVRWRADRCMAPGCGIPATRCEIDHTLAWEHGGSTAVTNLAPLCKGHHTVKHHGGWQVKQHADSGGALEWTSPAGRRYVVQPTRRTPVFSPAMSGDPPF